MSATIAWRGAVAAPIRIHDPNRRGRRCWFARSPNLVNVTRGGGMPGPGMGWSVRSVTRASRVHRVASPSRISMSTCRGRRARVDSMIERGRTPSTTRDDGQKPEEGEGEDSETQPPGDDLNPDELEDDDYVYVGDDWNDVGPSLAPSIVTACLGAFLFGYHSAVINAPLADIAEDLGFGGDNVAKGAIVSIMVVGGFAGGLGIGPFSDKEGRRAALVATTVPLALGTLICGGANSFWTMMLGRFVTGAGVGASTQIVPMYLSEVSPPGLRGTVNGIRRMGYVVGCLMAFQLCGPLKDANMPDGYVKPVRMNGAGVDTYIDAVQSKGKFAVVAEKVKETAAAAGKDVVVRVESKVEKLEEKLKVATEKDSSLTSGSIPSSISSSTSTDRAAGALAATSADAKAAPAVKLATTERPGVTPPVETAVKPATGKAGTEMGEKPEKAEKKAEPGKLPEASTAAAAPTKAPPESPSPPASTEAPKPMADAVKKSSTETSPAKESPPTSTSTSATSSAEAKKSTTSPGASKAEAQKTADAAAIAAYESATTSSLAPKPTADVASTKAAAAAVAKTVSKESNSQGVVVSEESVAAVEAVVGIPTATADDATRKEFVELKAIVKDAAAVETTVSSTVTSTEAKPEAKPNVGAEIEKKEKALLTEKPAVKSEDKPATVLEKEMVKETAVVASPVAKDVASNAVPVVAKDALKDVVSKDVVSKDVSKEVSKESKPSVDDAAAVKKDSPDASSTKKDPAAVTTGSALKKEKVDLEEKAAARIEEKSSKKLSGDASASPKPTTTILSTSASTATSKDKGAKGVTSTTTTSTSTPATVTVESAKKAAAVKGPPEVIRAEPGWWRPLFYVAAIPAVAQAAGALSGVAVESPVWLLGPEGCAMESRRSLAKLLGIRGRAAVRWQEAVAGSGVVIGMGKQGRVFKTVDEEDEEEGELDEDGNLCVKCSFDPDESEAAVNSWGALFTEQRNRYPMIIGAGVCLLAGLSGSNTVIYYASSVLKEAGVDDPGLLTLVVGLPNVLGGVIALLCTDKYGRRPLLLWSFGGMAVCLAAFSTAAFATPGNPVNNTFCALATPVTSGGLQEGGEFVGDAMAAICDDLAAYTTATVTQRSFEPLRTTTLVAIPLYTFFFSMGAGPVPWLLYSEVFPTRIRARATAVVTAINYSCNTIVGASFLPLIGAFGLKGTYAMYAVLCAVGYVFVDNLVFETKGLALQDIEGVMLTKEAQWSGRELASSEEDGDAYGQTGAGEDANEDSALGSGFWWTEVGEKMEKVIGDVRRSMDELATAEVEEEAAASIEDDEETIDVDVK